VAAEASAIGRHLSTLCQALLCSRSRRSQQLTGDVIGGTNARGPRTERQLQRRRGRLEVRAFAFEPRLHQRPVLA